MNQILIHNLPCSYSFSLITSGLTTLCNQRHDIRSLRSRGLSSSWHGSPPLCALPWDTSTLVPRQGTMNREEKACLTKGKGWDKGVQRRFLRRLERKRIVTVECVTQLRVTVEIWGTWWNFSVKSFTWPPSEGLVDMDPEGGFRDGIMRDTWISLHHQFLGETFQMQKEEARPLTC